MSPGLFYLRRILTLPNVLLFFFQLIVMRKYPQYALWRSYEYPVVLVKTVLQFTLTNSFIEDIIQVNKLLKLTLKDIHYYNILGLDLRLYRN